MSPLFQVCAEAGLIPGQLSEEIDVRDATETKVNKNDDGEYSDSDIESDLDDAESMKGKKFVSIILTNLEENYAKWQAQLPPENPSDDTPKVSETTAPVIITENEDKNTEKD